jgi:hypothetical protein
MPKIYQGFLLEALIYERLQSEHLDAPSKTCHHRLSRRSEEGKAIRGVENVDDGTTSYKDSRHRANLLSNEKPSTGCEKRTGLAGGGSSSSSRMDRQTGLRLAHLTTLVLLRSTALRLGR